MSPLKKETYRYYFSAASVSASASSGKWFSCDNFSSLERINSKLHGKVHYHDSSDKFDNQNYSHLFKRVIAL